MEIIFTEGRLHLLGSASSNFDGKLADDVSCSPTLYMSRFDVIKILVRN